MKTLMRVLVETFSIAPQGDIVEISAISADPTKPAAIAFYLSYGPIVLMADISSPDKTYRYAVAYRDGALDAEWALHALNRFEQWTAKDNLLLSPLESNLPASHIKEILRQAINPQATNTPEPAPPAPPVPPAPPAQLQTRPTWKALAVAFAIGLTAGLAACQFF